MANPNPKVDHLINHEGKNTFSESNQPSGKAKSEGWLKKNFQKQIRDNILKEMYKRAGFLEDGTSKLDAKFAQEMLKKVFDDNPDLKGFNDIFKDLLPEKVKQTNIVDEEGNTVGLQINFVEAKKTTTDK